jgi:hypothetical protein
MEDWRKYYNEDRPHGAIGNKPPIMLLNPQWPSQPAIVRELENSSLRRSIEWSQSNEPENSSFRRSKEWCQSTR